ncbi:hypothetical protein GQ457_03G022860 [Hibiscus cannabinus]
MPIELNAHILFGLLTENFLKGIYDNNDTWHTSIEGHKENFLKGLYDNNDTWHTSTEGIMQTENFLKSLYDNNDTWHTSTEGIMQTAIGYFQNPFLTSNLDIPTTILSNIRSSITPTMDEGRGGPGCHPIVYGSHLWGADMSSVNQIVLVLIPKTNDPTRMRHLRPITMIPRQ